MAQKYPNDGNWRKQVSGNGNIKEEVEKYLDEWVKIADGVSEEKKTLIVDLT